ncbi:hypothetical protein FNJ47_27940 [Bradyrhizobium sp. UFLA 03-164]|uniref:Uncharacterized protein n=1 Tax=Bradyrhizobium uaiense TaxID=2594946 RepID=A0A6P1BM16_9BRAD|nr:hypothetical protein [Bradyrhizobium uaiense]
MLEGIDWWNPQRTSRPQRGPRRKIRRLALWGVTTRSICDLLRRMDEDREAIPDDIAALMEALAIEPVKAFEITSRTSKGAGLRSSALIAQQKLRIASSSIRSTDAYQRAGLA